MGFEGLRTNLAEIRQRLSAGSSPPPHLSWFFRLDAQVAEVYGSASWPLTHYARDIEQLWAAGDEIGIHTHAFRWDEAGRSWMTDHGDQSWVDRAVRSTFETFERTLGSRCRTFRFGDHWMNDATVRLLEELGVHIDLTLEPGTPSRSSLIDTERYTGVTPDLTAAPRAPFRPSRLDFRVADPNRSDGLWMMPVTTGRLPPHLQRGRSIYRWLTRARDAEFDVLALNPGLALVLFRALAARILKPDPPTCLVLPLRSNIGAKARGLATLRGNLEYLLTHPLRERFVFCTPSEALALTRGPGNT